MAEAPPGSATEAKATPERPVEAAPVPDEGEPSDEGAPDKDKGKDKDKDSKHHKVRVSGFMQVFFRYSLHTGEGGAVDPSNFRVQRVRVVLDGEVSRSLAYKVSFDPRSSELGGILRDAYFDVKRVIPHHRIRVGQQKTIFGYENDESSSRLFTVNRAEVSDNLGGGVSIRDLGISLIGRVPLGEHLDLEDGISVVNGAGLNAQEDNNREKNVLGRVGLRYRTPSFRLRGGISGAYGDLLDPGDDPISPLDDLDVSFKRIGADLQLDHRWLLASAEVIIGDEETAGESETRSGYYVNLVGKTGFPVGPIARFDTLGEEYQRLTMGLYYGDLDARFRLLLNYELRLLREDERGDDKLYLWSQVRF